MNRTTRRQGSISLSCNYTLMKSTQAILYFFSEILENMVNIIAWNPSICFCCCCSCWAINFIIASFFAASCCNSCFFSSSFSFPNLSSLSFLSFRYSRVLFPLDLLFLPFPSFSLLYVLSPSLSIALFLTSSASFLSSFTFLFCATVSCWSRSASCSLTMRSSRACSTSVSSGVLIPLDLSSSFDLFELFHALCQQKGLVGSISLTKIKSFSSVQNILS